MASKTRQSSANGYLYLSSLLDQSASRTAMAGASNSGANSVTQHNNVRRRCQGMERRLLFFLQRVNL